MKKDKTFVALNTLGPPTLNSSGERSGEGGEVVLGSLSPAVGGELQEMGDLTIIGARIQHLRDLQLYNGGLVFSNVERRKD